MPKKEGRGVVSKDLFLTAFSERMKQMGVCFKVGKSTNNLSPCIGSCLFRPIAVLEAGAAASGSSLSLSGVGVAKFKEAGKREDTRYARFKFNPSTKARDFFHENADLIATEFNEEKFLEVFNTIMDALAPPACSCSSYR